ncbi:MAG TPA: hypothetical protein VI583_18265, partial [Cyclobacteriaceae bacterium]|nr:hypothetical protein [Cyclobacteriaceae bacterium]
MNKVSLFLFILVVFGNSCRIRKVPDTFRAVFEENSFEHKWSIKSLNPDLPPDWSSFDFLTFAMKSSTSQRWFLRIFDKQGIRELRMQPVQGTWIRVSIPLKYVKRQNIQGRDVATIAKIQLPAICIGFTNRVGTISQVDSMGVVMYNPIGTPTLEIQDVRLTMKSEDDFLESGPLVDEYGQWIPFERTGIATKEELESDWREEEAVMESDTHQFNYCKYGGYAGTLARATGFFRVEKTDNKWWLVDPDGHLFFSTGSTTMSAWSDTRFEGREKIFKARPPDFTDSRKFGTFDDGKLLGIPGFKSFYSWNLYRRFGDSWYRNWVDLTVNRMENWGLNTIGKWADPDLEYSQRKAYVLFLRGWGIESGIMGMPDIYAEDYLKQVDSAASVQCAPRTYDPWLLGYLIGQEPPWVDRALEVVETVLEGPRTPMQDELRKFLEINDSPDRRRAFIYDTYSRFVDIIHAAIRKHDPNHLILGYGFAGSAPAQVIEASKRSFDIFSFTSFDYVANLNLIQQIYEMTGMPVMIGEFHFGTPGRGIAAGLVQVKSLEERGVAYRHYVENTAPHPAIVGIHWFQWVDQPATGRMDGENYNTGIIDITDRPYIDLVNAMKETN